MVNGLTFLVLLDMVEAQREDLNDHLNEDGLPVIALLYRFQFLFLHVRFVL